MDSSNHTNSVLVFRTSQYSCIHHTRGSTQHTGGSIPWRAIVRNSSFRRSRSEHEASRDQWLRFDTWNTWLYRRKARKFTQGTSGQPTVSTIRCYNNVINFPGDSDTRIFSPCRYLQKARQLSQVFRDQPQTPLERAVFWTEYVLRHKGAPQLRSAARNLGFFQYFCIDVIAFILAILIGTISVIVFSCKFCYRTLCTSRSVGSAKKKQWAL